MAHWLPAQHRLNGQSTSLSFLSRFKTSILPIYDRWLAPLTEMVASLDISSKPESEAVPLIVEANVAVQVCSYRPFSDYALIGLGCEYSSD